MDSTRKNESLSNQCILITDSGLGGLSVFNNIANSLIQRSTWRSVRLVYFNAWPAPHRGYNHFETDERKNRVFNEALMRMETFDPDKILIACNTLSVIYPQTPFFKNSHTPVEGIVDHGVNMLYEKLAQDRDSLAVILGTPTTIKAKSHKTALVRMGIEPERIINVGCTNLAGWIEREPFSSEVEKMITTFAKETKEKLGHISKNIYAGLCCTHFGYKKDIFIDAFKKHVSQKVTFLDPNIRMADEAIKTGKDLQYSSVEIEMEIVSKAEWSDAQIDSYQKLIPKMSAQTSRALENYKLNTELFSVN